MSKICFPHYKKGEFESLQEAYTYLRKENYWSKYYLFDIVRFNVEKVILTPIVLFSQIYIGLLQRFKFAFLVMWETNL